MVNSVHQIGQQFTYQLGQFESILIKMDYLDKSIASRGIRVSSFVF